MNRTDFQRLADMRIDEAKHLLDQGKWAGAYYLAGYAVECALKACIAKLTSAEDFPDKEFATKCFTHNLDKLMKLAGLQAQLDADAPKGTPRADNWATVQAWTEGSRYELGTSQAEAEGLYDAITNATEGVLPWVKAHW